MVIFLTINRGPESKEIGINAPDYKQKYLEKLEKVEKELFEKKYIVISPKEVFKNDVLYQAYTYSIIPRCDCLLIINSREKDSGEINEQVKLALSNYKSVIRINEDLCII